jgi:hypothetical protein
MHAEGGHCFVPSSGCPSPPPPATSAQHMSLCVSTREGKGERCCCPASEQGCMERGTSAWLHDMLKQ